MKITWRIEQNKQETFKKKGEEVFICTKVKYLQPSQISIKHKDAITIFRLRSRMTDIKVNF